MVNKTVPEVREKSPETPDTHTEATRAEVVPEALVRPQVLPLNGKQEQANSSQITKILVKAFIKVFFWILPKPFCPYCGKRLKADPDRPTVFKCSCGCVYRLVIAKMCKQCSREKVEGKEVKGK